MALVPALETLHLGEDLHGSLAVERRRVAGGKHRQGPPQALHGRRGEFLYAPTVADRRS